MKLKEITYLFIVSLVGIVIILIFLEEFAV